MSYSKTFGQELRSMSDDDLSDLNRELLMMFKAKTASDEFRKGDKVKWSAAELRKMTIPKDQAKAMTGTISKVDDDGTYVLYWVDWKGAPEEFPHKNGVYTVRVKPSAIQKAK